LIGGDKVAVLLRFREGRTGRALYSPLMLFKALLLQRWYGLSDEALEDALYDPLSFSPLRGSRRSPGLCGHGLRQRRHARAARTFSFA
jgi:IS5 family transposase